MTIRDSDMWTMPDRLFNEAADYRPPATRWVVLAELPAGYLTAPDVRAAQARAVRMFPSFPGVRVTSLASAEVALEDERIVIHNDRIAQLRAAVLAARAALDPEGQLTPLPPRDDDEAAA